MKESAKQKKEKSLKYSIIDGAFYSAMVGFGESFMSAFGVFLNATSFQIGLLGSLPRTIGYLFQLLSTKLTAMFGSRKKFVSLMTLLQALTYIPIALSFYFDSMSVPLLILFTSLYWIFGMIASPAWNSWMGDLVDPNKRGEYFGKRNKIANITSFLSFVAAGYILDALSVSRLLEFVGYAIIFGLALVTRLISFVYLIKKHEPRTVFKAKNEFSLIDFVKESTHRNFGLFTLYMVVINFGVYFSAPFFTPYMLDDLMMNYSTYTIVTAAAIISKVVMMPIWGKLSDTYGTKKVLTVSGLTMPFIPLLWVFSGDIYYLIFAQILSGFLWAGFEIASFNFMFDTTKPKNRATCISYFNALTGITMLLGAIAGGFILKTNDVFQSKYLFVFFVSFLIRMAASLYFIPYLREVRFVENISHRRLLMKAISMGTTSGIRYRLVAFGKESELTAKQAIEKFRLRKNKK